MKTTDDGNIRKFETGATRDTGANKNDYEGFLSPLVIEAFGDYMNENRLQTDGSLRDSDNWQKGIPQPVYIKSAFRHFFQWWKLHRGLPAFDEKGRPVDLKHAIGGLLFNAMGYLHESLKAQECKVKEPPKVTPTVAVRDYPRFFKRGCTIFVIVTEDIGRACYSDMEDKRWWGASNWALMGMTLPWACEDGSDRPKEISADAAVLAGLPNNTDTWPVELRSNGWPHGRPLLISVVKNTPTESPLNG